METKIENSAAGTVISSSADPLIFRKRAHYQINMAILDTMLRRGELSETDHALCWLVIMAWIKAAFFGRFTHLLFGSIRANM